MSRYLCIIIFHFFSITIFSQETVPRDNARVSTTDTIKPGKGSTEKQLKGIKEERIKKLSDSTNNEPIKSQLVDTTTNNKYGNLLNDDTAFNKKSSIWKPLLQSFGTNVIVWSFDRVVLNAEYARISMSTWKSNVTKGWEWDKDRFGINFIGHPYSGTLSYNAGRSNGYNYYQSFGYSVAGSLMWEYFGENTKPSYNDIINTPVNGAFLGEILYRLSSNILDDRTSGANRFWREFLAGLVDPMRGFNRLMQGKTHRKTNVEVYQKEPLNTSVYIGWHKMNDQVNQPFGAGNNSASLNIQFDYGNPFEKRVRKPFDFFKLRSEFNVGNGRKIIDNILGYGILFGKNVDYKKHSILFGVFQYYDYWDNKTFELGTIAFGPGLFSKYQISKTSNLYSNIHISLVPFSGNSTHFGPDTSQFRDYNYGGGLEGKIESTLNLDKFATLSLFYYYYFIHTYVGLPGNNLIGIFKPRVTIKVYKNLSLGYEHFVYSNNRYLIDYPLIHLVHSEEKLFIQLFLEDKQRRGHYN
jgi:hypothetical protein